METPSPSFLLKFTKGYWAEFQVYQKPHSTSYTIYSKGLISPSFRGDYKFQSDIMVKLVYTRLDEENSCVGSRKVDSQPWIIWPDRKAGVFKSLFAQPNYPAESVFIQATVILSLPLISFHFLYLFITLHCVCLAHNYSADTLWTECLTLKEKERNKVSK